MRLRTRITNTNHGSISCGGFTLLEVMVSLVILATAFAAVLRLHSDSLSLLISSRVHMKAAELAQYKMTELEMTGLKNLSLMSGEFGELAPEYLWNITLEPTSFQPWTKVVVTVTNRNLRKGGEYQLVEYMLPEPMRGPPKR